MPRKYFIYWLAILSFTILEGLIWHIPTANSQDVPCGQRPTQVDPPWVDGTRWCLERVIQDDEGGELAFTSLAVAPDGTLYATRPLTGEVLAIEDTDTDGLPDTPRVVAEGLTLPNGLAYYENALYISGGIHLYRLKGNEVETIVDNLPTENGFWTGGLTIGPDARIYVGVGAPCDYCEPGIRGAVWSFTLDGRDQKIVAMGLRQPADIAFRDAAMWTVDSARDNITDTDLDELNRVTEGANFGWPYCIGADNHPDTLDGTFSCADAIPPSLTFPTHSQPLGMAFYEANAFPDIRGDLLVALGGSNDQWNLEGYTLVLVHFDPSNNQPMSYKIIIPEQAPGIGNKPELQSIHYQGSGLWPHRPYDVAVSPEGWIYVSVGGGTIYVLRPL